MGCCGERGLEVEFGGRKQMVITYNSAFLKIKFYSIYKVNMKETNKCGWLLLGKNNICGRNCKGEYCYIHNAKLVRGGGTGACTVCGKGVKNPYLVCNICGYYKVYDKKWSKGYRVYEAEVRRLKNIVI